MQHLHDRQAGIEPDEVGEFKRPHRMVCVRIASGPRHGTGDVDGYRRPLADRLGYAAGRRSKTAGLPPATRCRTWPPPRAADGERDLERLKSWAFKKRIGNTSGSPTKLHRAKNASVAKIVGFA